MLSLRTRGENGLFIVEVIPYKRKHAKKTEVRKGNEAVGRLCGKGKTESDCKESGRKKEGRCV